MRRYSLAVGLALGAVLAGLGLPALAAGQPYAGQQHRAIKALSKGDVADLLAGRGWGLAKPAELNGYPGPAHVLELRDELGLSPQQIAVVEAVFETMQQQAATLGREYVEAERALDALFAAGTATPQALARHTDAAGRLHAALRRTHLEAHLQIRPLLTAEQIARYRRLRGYAEMEHHKHAH
jgi:Spy/CpxP family protein refolding chaperone